MKDKKVIITGANSGIGKAMAIALAGMGAHIIMVCRNEEKAYDAMQDIIQVSGNSNINVVLCDFSEQRQIHRASEDIHILLEHADVLINNAGLFMSKRQLTIDGFEMTFAVNHLGYFLFTHLMLDLLKAAPEARIVNVSSAAHRWVNQFDWNNLQAEKRFSKMQAYAISKLCNILFTYELARKLKGSHITANCLHPGAVSTNIGNSSGWFFSRIFKLGRSFLLTPEQGAATSIYLASSPKVKGVSGKYFSNKRIQASSPISRSKDIAKRLWEMSKEMTGME